VLKNAWHSCDDDQRIREVSPLHSIFYIVKGRAERLLLLQDMTDTVFIHFHTMNFDNTVQDRITQEMVTDFHKKNKKDLMNSYKVKHKQHYSTQSN
jgi:hypothetical protein